MSRNGFLKRVVLALAVFAIVGVVAGTAKADIVVITSVDNTGTNNVLLNPATNVSLVTGTVGPMNLVVNFTSSGGLLSAPASGQARVTGGTGNDPFSQLTFGLADPGGVFTNAVFNINAGANGSVTILVQGINITGGSFSQSFTLDANGENFFTISAINGQLITSISLTATGGANFEDVRQVRIGGEHIIPEPASMVLLGTGLIGVAAGFRKRFRKK